MNSNYIFAGLALGALYIYTRKDDSIPLDLIDPNNLKWSVTNYKIGKSMPPDQTSLNHQYRSIPISYVIKGDITHPGQELLKQAYLSFDLSGAWNGNINLKKEIHIGKFFSAIKEAERTGEL